VGIPATGFCSRGFRAIGYSRRGYFRSESGNPEEPGLASEDLNRLIEHLKLDKVHIVAMAHGAFFTLDFALTHAQKLRSLTITSSILGIADSETD
jgi:pimeloyl-ACP methyl ester carboxylesterase